MPSALSRLTPEMRAQMREAFFEEAADMAAQLEASLLALEQAPADADVVNEAFRAAHTLKGSSASVDLQRVAAYTHELETALEGVRSHRVELTPAGLALLLEGLDILRTLLAAEREGRPGPEPEAYLVRLETAFPRLPQSTPAPKRVAVPTVALPVSPLHGLSPEELLVLAAQKAPDTELFRIAWRLPPEAFNFGLDPLVLVGALADEALLLRVAPAVDLVPALAVLDPHQCHLAFTAIVAAAPQADLRAVFEFCPPETAVEIVWLKTPVPVNLAAPEPASPVEPRAAPIAGSTPEPTPANTEGQLDAPQPASAPSGNGAVGSAAAQSRAAADQMLRVKQSRLDAVINLVGELVTARNELLHLQGLMDQDDRLGALARQMKSTTGTVNRVVNQLQADVLGLRLVQMRSVFQRLPRTVHDVAAQLGKKVVYEADGEDTEVDKTVADTLADPLIHLARNAVDHGLETPETRLAAGKPEEGHVWLSAARESNRLVITVRDDGQGLDPGKLRRTAVAKGLITPAAGERLSDAEALNLIFLPGFSTAQKISDISGRGVGLDVVKNNVTRIGGTFNVEARRGEGTSFHLYLPLTLSIFRGLTLQAAGTSLIVPLEAVRETTAVTAAQVRTLRGRPVATIRGELVGLVGLDEALGYAEQAKAWLNQEREVIVVETGRDRVGLLVDRIDSPQDIMVKPLEDYLSGGGAVAGAAVMGDGRVALVLDPAGLMRWALQREGQN